MSLPSNPNPTSQDPAAAVVHGRAPDVWIEGPAGQDAMPAVARIVGTATLSFGGRGNLTQTYPQTREVRLERRLNATCAASEGLTDPRNILAEDKDYLILRREAVERARGFARRNKRDLESGGI